MIKAVFFDLDGTLADTAPDLAAALNQLLEERELPSLPLAVIRPVVSQGANALLRLAFALEKEDPEFDTLQQRFLEIYAARLHNGTDLFPGMAEVLTALDADGIKWGVITNKPAWLTTSLIHKLGLDQRAVCVISGDSTEYKKPHPAPLLYACETADIEPGDSVYIGDARRDIEAGQSAGMHTLVAKYGYIDEQEHPDQWLANGMISEPQEIIDWIHNYSPD